MKILFVSLFLPLEKSYHAGGRYVFELIRSLSARHEVHLATRLDETEVPLLATLRPFCREIYPYIYKSGGNRGAADLISLILNYMGFSRHAGRLSQTGNFDIIQVEWTEAALLMKRIKGVPMVLDAHDVITKPAERLKEAGVGLQRIFRWLKYAAVRALERRIAGRFDMIFTRSKFDRDYLLSLVPGLKVSVVAHPAGLDITEKQFKKDENAVLFLASYKYRKINVEAALFFYRSVFPLVRKAVPAARFIAAGYGPPEELTELGKRDAGVEVPGFVADIDECYKRAAVFVAPILVGGGIIVKILDAMAAGLPVVTTSYGNEGIGASPGRDLLVGDDPETFAAAVVSLLRDPGFAREVGMNGKAFVKENYSRESVLRKIEAVYEELKESAKGESRGERRRAGNTIKKD